MLNETERLKRISVNVNLVGIRFERQFYSCFYSGENFPGWSIWFLGLLKGGYKFIMGTFSIWHWLIVLLVIILVFGTKKLKNLGSDLGGAVRGFKDGLKEGNKEEGLSSIESNETKDLSESETFTVQAREKNKE